MFRSFTLILVLCLMTSLGAELLTPTLYPSESAVLKEMLVSAELDSTSLTFEKDWDLSTKFKSPRQISALQNPWQALEQISELKGCYAKPILNLNWDKDRGKDVPSAPRYHID